MLQARQAAGLTQAQIAERMGTKPPAVTRLEASLSSGKHSPSLATLRKYAEAVGCRLEVRLVRARRGLQGHRADALKRAAHAQQRHPHALFQNPHEDPHQVFHIVR